MEEAKEQFKYKDWVLQTTYDDKILVQKLGEVREYDIDYIDTFKQSDEYIMFYHNDGTFTQVKFEEQDFLVIDKFDADGEFCEPMGMHQFGEEAGDE